MVLEGEITKKKKFSINWNLIYDHKFKVSNTVIKSKPWHKQILSYKHEIYSVYSKTLISQILTKYSSILKKVYEGSELGKKQSMFFFNFSHIESKLIVSLREEGLYNNDLGLLF